MASDTAFAEEICTLLGCTCKKMFGEYTLYLREKPVALICDNRLFIKPAKTVRQLLGSSAVEAPPYPSARPHFLIAEPRNREKILPLLEAAFAELPFPRTKKNKPQ